METYIYEALMNIHRDLQDLIETIKNQGAYRELEKWKNLIEKFPNYEDWIAEYNCGGRHD